MILAHIKLSSLFSITNPLFTVSSKWFATITSMQHAKEPVQPGANTVYKSNKRLFFPISIKIKGPRKKFYIFEH